MFDQLDFINREVQKKGEKVQKLRGGIVYQTEGEIDLQIRKLEYQIQKHNFKLAEEKRIVLEIDRLKRSKKNLQEYIVLKGELDALRDEQRTIRNQREVGFREFRELKRSEDLLRLNLKENSARAESLKAEIEQAREDKRSLIQQFRSQETEYRNYQQQRREEQQRKLQEDRDQKAAEVRRELEELKSSSEPFQDERNHCNLLIKYCENLLGPNTRENTPVGGTESNLLMLPSSSVRRRSSGFSTYSDCSSRYATPLGKHKLNFPIGNLQW